MNVKTYDVIEHPADLKLKIFGKSLPDLFCNLVRAIASEQLGSLVSKLATPEDWESFEITSPDLFSLWVDFASEIVYRSDVSGKVYTDCVVDEITGNTILRSRDYMLKARICGIRTKKGLDIKAATYHEGYVKKVNEEWEGVILFDI